jgi:acyl-CoA thioester hydrolase
VSTDQSSNRASLRRRRQQSQGSSLVNRMEIEVRFSEMDPMGVVWHGNYLLYFEDGREAFGREFGLGYMDFFNNQVMAPIVHLECDYRKSLRFGERAVIETNYVYTESAKIIFNYTIRSMATGEVMATGTSTQVFTDVRGEIIFSNPRFYLDWKRQWRFLADE